MNYCKKCSRILDSSDATVCPYCGEPLEEAVGSPASEALQNQTTDFNDVGMANEDIEPAPSTNEEVLFEPPDTEPIAEVSSPETEAPVTAAPEVDLDSKLDEINRRIADNKQSGKVDVPPAAQSYPSYGSSPTVPPSASYSSAPTPPPPPYGKAPTPPPPPYGSAPTPPPPASYGPAPSGTGYSAPPRNNGPYGAAPPRYAPAPAPASDNSATGIGYLILAIFLPVIGLIVGVVMMNDVTPKKKRDGKNVLYVSLIQIGFFVLMCCCLFALGTSGLDSLYDLF